MKLKTIQWVLYVSIPIFIISCEYNKEPEPIKKPVNVSDTSGIDTVVQSAVSFINSIIPRFQARCAVSDCHDGVTSATTTISPVLTTDTAYFELWEGGYIDTANSENSILYQQINGGEMTDNATDEDRDTILQWIVEGALNN